MLCYAENKLVSLLLDAERLRVVISSHTEIGCVGRNRVWRVFVRVMNVVQLYCRDIE